MTKKSAPLDVLITEEQKPIPVEVVSIEDELSKALVPQASATTVTKGEGTTLSPTTTESEDKVTEGQRHINLLWEGSQSAISIMITAAVIYCQIKSINSETLNNAFFFVVATYLQRTNHTRRGGVEPEYKGR